MVEWSLFFKSCRGGGLNAFAKRIDPSQTALTAQADAGQNFFAVFKFSACRRSILPYDSVGCLKEWILWIYD